MISVHWDEINREAGERTGVYGDRISDDGDSVLSVRLNDSHVMAIDGEDVVRVTRDVGETEPIPASTRAVRSALTASAYTGL